MVLPYKSAFFTVVNQNYEKCNTIHILNIKVIDFFYISNVSLMSHSNIIVKYAVYKYFMINWRIYAIQYMK